MTPNGPAIKLVGVAERMEVVTTNPIRGTSRYTTGMNEAWHVFLQSGYKLPGVYACRGTNFIASRKQVKVHRVLKKAGERSGFVTFYKAV